MRDIVWVVLAQDRQLMQVCSSSEYAKEQARAMGGVYESWPVDQSARTKAWEHAIQVAHDFRPPGAIV